MNNVVLVGFMGSGKSTVGRMLAERTNRSFVDLDDDIAADAGRSISEIFADEGEAGFRQREAHSLRRALNKRDIIVAAGGGAPLPDENWRQMRDGNCVVSLMAEPAELARRLNGSSGRPLLQPDVPSAILMSRTTLSRGFRAAAFIGWPSTCQVLLTKLRLVDACRASLPRR